MSPKRFLTALALAALFVNAGYAQGPTPDVTVPEISWQLGTLRGIQLRKGVGVDYLLQFTVVVPEGTAASYSVSVDVCKWAPVVNNVPEEVESCASTEETPVILLAEVEPGRVYSGAIRHGYDPSNLTYKRVNRFSYTLSLRQLDGPDPARVIARQELNDVIFAGIKNKGGQNAAAASAPPAPGPSVEPRVLSLRPAGGRD